MVKFESHNGKVNINFTGNSDILAAEIADLCIEICSSNETMHYFGHVIDGVQSTLKKMKELQDD